jgi:hypothetical protein
MIERLMAGACSLEKNLEITRYLRLPYIFIQATRTKARLGLHIFRRSLARDRTRPFGACFDYSL